MAALHIAALPPGWCAESIAQTMESPGGNGFVFFEEHVSGFILVRAVADEAEILTIAVATGRRRRGAGRALLDAAVRAVRAAGAQQLHLEVAADNAVARAFYASEGFVETGRRARYYPDGADALLLSRAIV